MSAQELPQELLDLVIDHLNGDFPALKLLSQISRPWSQRTRQHIFQRISLKSNIRCITLKELITGRPELSQYIQAVEVRHEDRYLPPLYATPSNLCDLLVLLPAVTKLSLGGALRLIEWDSVPDELQSALYDVMKRVTSLELANISSFQIAPLAQCQQLKELSLVEVDLQPAMYTQPSLSALPSNSQKLSGRLQRLTVGNCAEALKALIALQPFCTIDLCHPTELVVNAFKFGSDMATALGHCCSAVESYYAFALTDRPEFTNPFTDTMIDFSRTPRIKHLCIRLAYYHWLAQINSTILEPIAHGLDGVLGSSNLETVTILLEFAPPPTRPKAGTEVDVYFAATREAWGLLDDVLSKDVFGKLQAVLLVFGTPNHTEQNCRWPGLWPARDRLIDKMPKMTAKGVLNITRSRSHPS